METELKKEIQSLDDRIDRHIEAYAKNGRELVRLSGLIETHLKEDSAFKENLKPVLENYLTLVNGSKIIKNVAYFIAAIGVLAAFVVKFMNK